MAHLTENQRYTIYRMLEQGYKQSVIARTIGKDKSVISRELKRNSDARNGTYKADLAQRKAIKRQREKPKKRAFTFEIQQETEKLLRKDYSPEQVVGTLKKEGKASVSVERIYQHIWADKKSKGDLHTHLRNKGRKYRKRGSAKDQRGIIKNRVSIDQRPPIVAKKERFGDFEIDLVIGKNHKEALVTLNDRVSGVVKIRKIPSKKAEIVAEAACEMLYDWQPFLYTITADNGKEFAAHELIAKNLEIDFYFAHPYHSWERGANENLNGLVRQYFTKGSDFTNITDEEVQNVENILNNRPRKRLEYQSPNQRMNQLLFNEKVAFVD